MCVWKRDHLSQFIHYNWQMCVDGIVVFFIIIKISLVLLINLSKMEANKTFLEEFIEIDKKNACLRKVKSREDSDRNKKAAADEKLLKKLREIEPTANKESAVKKINNIRSAFRKEVKKVKEILKSGAGEEDYKPHLWYFALLNFLTDRKTAKHSVSNIGEDQSEVRY